MAEAAEPKYSFGDGDVVFEVESTPYRIHSFHLQRATRYFDRDIQERNEGDTKPIILEDAKRADFENLLWFFYESSYQWHGLVDDSLKDQWESALLLADKFEMRQVAIVASHALDCAKALSDIGKILLCIKHVRGKEWVMEELIRVVEREQPLTHEESCQIGPRASIALAAAREHYHRLEYMPIPCQYPGLCPRGHNYAVQRTIRCVRGMHVCGESGHIATECPAVASVTARQSVQDYVLIENELFSPLPNGNDLHASEALGPGQGDAVFKIGNSQYRLHSYHLKRASRVFADMYLLPQSTSEGAVSGEPVADTAITLDVKAEDFENLIWFFYQSHYEWTPTIPDAPATSTKWESVLALADMFDMEEVARVATYALDRCGVLSDMRKIALCVRHALSREWALEALKNVCSRAQAVSVEEAKGMGAEMTALVAQVRERFICNGREESTLEEIVRNVMLQ